MTGWTLPRPRPADAEPDPRPELLDLTAAELWTGDLTDEGRVVFALDRFTSAGPVMVTLVTMVVDENDGIAAPKRFEDRPYAPDEALRVVRGAPLPDGSYMYRYDLAKGCHGTVLGTGERCGCGGLRCDA